MSDTLERIQGVLEIVRTGGREWTIKKNGHLTTFKYKRLWEAKAFLRRHAPPVVR